MGTQHLAKRLRRPVALFYFGVASSLPLPLSLRKLPSEEIVEDEVAYDLLVVENTDDVSFVEI